MTKPKIFVSHSSLDVEFAARLVADLNAAGAQAWLNSGESGARDVQARIDEALADCEWFVLVLTPNALRSNRVRQELASANRLRQQKRIKDVIFIKAAEVEYRQLHVPRGVFQIFDATTDYTKAVAKVLTTVGLAPLEPHPPSTTSSGWSALVGSRFDRYDILGELNRGSPLRMLHAFDSALKRDVAIKLFPNDSEDGTFFRNHFEHEAEAIGRLHHPNVIEAYAAGENDGFLFMVMQYASGGALRHRIHGPMPVAEAVAYAVQIAHALQHAHTRGVIHRDVKPANMLLERPGSSRLLLTDFSIAMIQGARSLTKPGMTIGTPEFMSPEQAEGRDIDERTDIYALGCVLYEMLAGRPPFRGATPLSVLFQQVHSRPASIRGLNPDLPAELARILDVALAKRPTERFESAEAFARALLPFAGELPSNSLHDNT